MNLANKITIARILLIPFFVALVLYSRIDLALWVFLLAVLSDALDGYIARTWKQKTKLGALLDPVADKFLIISAFVCLVFVRGLPLIIKLPPYVPIVVISRDIIIVLGVILIYITKGDIEVRPSILGKITTFLQMLTIIFVLAQFKYAVFLWNIMVVSTVISGVEYVREGSKVLSERQ